MLGLRGEDYRAIEILTESDYCKKMSAWSLTYQQGIFKHHHSHKYLLTFFPTRWRRKTAGIDMKRNYVTVTLYVYSVSRKSEPPNVLHWEMQTCPVLSKIKRAVAQKYLSYCRQISYDSIIALNRFSILQIVVTVTDTTRLLRTTHVTDVTHDVILSINKMLSKEDRVYVVLKE